MKGIIGIYHHCINCLIGCQAEERVKEQEIFVDVKIKFDFSACVLSDQITDTIDYMEIATMCTELAQSKQYHLLEALAHDILNQLIRDWRIEWAWVSIKKPSAVPSAHYAMVELEHYR